MIPCPLNQSECPARRRLQWLYRLGRLSLASYVIFAILGAVVLAAHSSPFDVDLAIAQTRLEAIEKTINEMREEHNWLFKAQLAQLASALVAAVLFIITHKWRA